VSNPVTAPPQCKASELQKEAPLESNKDTFNSARVLLNKEVQKAKHRSEFNKAVKIMEMIHTRPQKAWKKMHSLEAGHNSHHPMNNEPSGYNFAQYSVKATNDEENIKEITCNHFEKVYNR
jgi:hypothetical protein